LDDLFSVRWQGNMSMTLLLPARKDGVVAVRALSRSERGGEDGTKGDVGVDAALKEDVSGVFQLIMHAALAAVKQKRMVSNRRRTYKLTIIGEIP
jgi:predicted Kef-type K+ transport protein